MIDFERLKLENAALSQEIGSRGRAADELQQATDDTVEVRCAHLFACDARKKLAGTWQDGRAVVARACRRCCACGRGCGMLAHSGQGCRPRGTD